MVFFIERLIRKPRGEYGDIIVYGFYRVIDRGLERVVDKSWLVPFFSGRFSGLQVVVLGGWYVSIGVSCGVSSDRLG